MPQFDREQLKKAQKASLLILKEVDRICKKHGIRYLLDSGTLLGAVRHKGFIPWDDDLDIAMLHTEFDRFRKACEEELSESFRLILPDEYRGGQAFYDFTPRIVFLNSKRHADSAEMDFYEGKLNHLWVDIFLLDNIPDNALSDRMTRFLQKAVYGLSMAHRFRVDLSKYQGADRVRVAALTALGRLVPMPALFRLQEGLSRKYGGTATKNLYYSNYQPDYLQDTVRREWSLETVELPFEDGRFPAPKGYDEVLRVIYGDYMQLPPEEQRVPSHSDGLEVEFEEA